VTSGTFLQNAAGAKLYGAEIDGSYAPIDRVHITYGFSALHAIYTSFQNAQVFLPTSAAACALVGATYPCGNSASIADVSGKSLPRAPFFTANLGADYTVPLHYGELTIAANMYYSGHSYWDQANRLKEPPHRLLNANVTWKAPEDRYSVTLWGENLLDQVYNLTVVNSSSDSHAYARPVSYGVRLNYHW
jgi:iron complex outermembrane receptor protein